LTLRNYHTIALFLQQVVDGTKRLDEKTPEKCKKPQTSVINYIGTKLILALLKRTLAAIQGFRDKRNHADPQGLIGDLSPHFPGPYFLKAEL